MQGARFIAANEIERLKAELPLRDRLLMLFGLTFGLRVSEAIPLTFGDVSGPRLVVVSLKKRQKQKKTVFPIPEKIRAVIEEVREYYLARKIEVTRHTPLFLSQKGGHVGRRYVAQVIERACRKLGLPEGISFHSFRKAFVTNIFAKTKFNVAETCRYSRHDNLNNLLFYIETCQDTNLVLDLDW